MLLEECMKQWLSNSTSGYVPKEMLWTSPRLFNYSFVYKCITLEPAYISGTYRRMGKLHKKIRLETISDLENVSYVMLEIYKHTLSLDKTGNRLNISQLRENSVHGFPSFSEFPQ